jgi:benzoylformate decarboxylase
VKDNKKTAPRTIIISNDRNSPNNQIRCDHSIIGHIGSVVSEISDHLDNNQNDQKFNERRDERLKMFESENIDGAIPKYKLAQSINNSLEDDIIFDEGITAGFVLRNYIDKDSINLYGLKGGGLGQGIGASIGLAIAEDKMNSNSNIVSYIGDGTFHYYPQGLYSASKYTDSITFIIPDNGGYEILQNNEMIESSNDSLNLGDADIESISESYGVPSDTYSFNMSLNDYIEKNINKDETNLITVPVC